MTEEQIERLLTAVESIESSLRRSAPPERLPNPRQPRFEHDVRLLVADMVRDELAKQR